MDDLDAKLSASQAKQRFGEALNHCVYGKKPIFIHRHQKTIAVLVSFEDWQQRVEPVDPQYVSSLYEEVQEFRKTLSQTRSGDEVSAEDWVDSVRFDQEDV